MQKENTRGVPTPCLLLLIKKKPIRELNYVIFFLKKENIRGFVKHH